MSEYREVWCGGCGKFKPRNEGKLVKCGTCPGSVWRCDDCNEEVDISEAENAVSD